MTPRQEPANALRHAALALHALGADDRRWILAALPTHQAQGLRALLRELQDLGIPAQGLPAESVLGIGSEAPPPDHLPLDKGVAARLVQLLRDEPPRVAALLVAAHAPAWRTRLMADVPASTTALPEWSATGSKPTPALQAAVLRAVRRRIDFVATPVARGPRSGWMWGLWRRGEAQ